MNLCGTGEMGCMSDPRLFSVLWVDANRDEICCFLFRILASSMPRAY